ncbi:ATP-binding protein [Halobacterium litoreum]|uniref:histidine kinase n=1 Tax=Halobacterium litoreum TaxID=2039234 RepID=A0ABD5NEC6_9EURY|nr:PAS domain-containing sensor histidine kinase [Halobacterium litoreum]UHH13494.1 PAS domain-containing sensor histidine kinase [Halobacterium litoreum]
MEQHSQRFDALFDDPNLLVALLDPDGTVQRVNETAVAYVDKSHDEIVGIPFWEAPWWSEDHEADVKQWIREATDGDYVEYEAEHPAGDGETAVVSGVFRPVTDDSGEVTTVLVSAKDITERRQQKRELQEQNKRFDEFASFISHDLQSPISAVNGRLELALETGDVEHVERASEALERVDALREDLVTTLRSREIVTNRESVDVADVFERAWRTIDPPSTTTYTVVEPVTVDADRDALQRLLENLVGNSVEHGSEHATVRIGALGDGFYYADDGPGIDPDARGQVFIPGFSTKRGEKGIGMGMASVRQIVTAHDWRIEIDDSDALGGVRFELHTE